jgi:hypothetical protein
MEDHRFWAKFFRELDEAVTLGFEDWKIDFPVGEGRGLSLLIEHDVWNQSLELRHPDRTDAGCVASEGPASDQFPHVLRWSELEVIGRAAALNDPDLIHPGPSLLLLCRFAPICVGDDLDLIVPMIKAAWQSIGDDSPRILASALDAIDARSAQIAWRRVEPHGWSPVQDETGRGPGQMTLSTLRRPDNPAFPHSSWDSMIETARRTCLSSIRPEWLGWEGGTIPDLARSIVEDGDLDSLPYLADALEEAGCDHPTILGGCRSGEPARACWVVETIAGVEPGTLVRRRFSGSNSLPIPPFSGDVSIPVSDPTNEGPPEAELAMIRALDRALRDADVGDAEYLPPEVFRTKDGRRVPEVVARARARVLRRPRFAIVLIFETLRAAGAPEDVRMHGVRPPRSIVPPREA